MDFGQHRRVLVCVRDTGTVIRKITKTQLAVVALARVGETLVIHYGQVQVAFDRDWQTTSTLQVQ